MHYGPILIESIIDRLADGRTTLRYQSTMILLDSFRDDAKEITRFDVDLTTSFNLRPADEKPIVLNNDGSIRPAVEKAITIDNFRLVSRQSYGGVQGGLNLTYDNPPVGLGFNVFIRAGQSERLIGSFVIPAGAGPGSRSFHGTWEDFPPDAATVDVILRPNAKAPLTTLDTFEVWNHEVVKKHVKVTGSVPPTPRATPAPPTSSPVR
jgi:hypothetical protein